MAAPLGGSMGADASGPSWASDSVEVNADLISSVSFFPSTKNGEALPLPPLAPDASPAATATAADFPPSPSPPTALASAIAPSGREFGSEKEDVRRWWW